MENHSDALPTIQFSQKRDSSKPRNWRTERAFYAVKKCPCCLKQFRPRMKISKNGSVVSAVSESAWSKQECCSPSCSKRWKNPMHNNESKEKMKASLRRIGHAPAIRGGNGKLPSPAQLCLWHALGHGWEMELPIKTHAGHLNGVYPNCYKVDIGNEKKKIAIEVDGSSHSASERLSQDFKKDEKLKELGWTVFRISNEDAMKMYITFESEDTLLISLMGS